MLTLSDSELAAITGGVDKMCAVATAGLALSIIGGLASLATLNPVGLVLSAGGIYTGGTSMLVACGYVELG